MKAATILMLGILVLAAGVLFTLQGSGVVHWPRESFMLDNRDWVERGIVVALIGLALILTAWRIRQPRP
jgi:hypothetical protein